MLIRSPSPPSCTGSISPSGRLYNKSWGSIVTYVAGYINLIITEWKGAAKFSVAFPSNPAPIWACSLAMQVVPFSKQAFLEHFCACFFFSFFRLQVIVIKKKYKEKNNFLNSHCPLKQLHFFFFLFFWLSYNSNYTSQSLAKQFLWLTNHVF